MIKRSSGFVLLCLVLLAAAGCSPRHKIQIDANVCWHGTVNEDQYINGCGASTYKVIGTLRCARVTKEAAGYLRMRIDDRPWTDTPDQYGYVQVCN